ncbi:PREDICTED: odorant receptor 4-like [Vollenhovia emeryi]|uniref:odorant receptor 4-like n=1 Tax=Vollenhovia emeryi TaxID=411798 RepID=UPI0005F4DC59|nr:PREDICTED: odorant receptor 4-like [Vollenhovia emeryi]XP_011880178.1 PREDICTED: odorant receptor 4-like [Vollenhovia emeryi]
MSNCKRAPKSDYSKQHNNYSLQLNRWYLTPIGAWPQMNDSNKTFKILVPLYIFVCQFTVALMTIPCILFVCFEKTNIKVKLGALGPLLHRLTGWINYWMLLKHSGDIRKLVQHMEVDWKIVNRIQDREVMLQYAKFGRFVAGICGMILYCGTFLFSIARNIRTVPTIVGNETFRTYPMTCPIYSKIIDARFSPVNEIALALQFTNTFIVNCSTVGACSLAAVFAMHARGQLNVLYTWLHELAENQDENQEENHIADRKMAVIVEHHIRVLSFIERVENIMNKISLVELTGCTIIMCLVGYYSVMEWQNFDAMKITSYINVYLSMAFNIFIFCYIGEIITEECKYVGEMAYMINWYNLNHKTAIGLVLIIARSSNVIKITAGKLFHLSIATFGDVIKTSMVYLNLLRQLTM